jgi:hypothetical protein
MRLGWPYEEPCRIPFASLAASCSSDRTAIACDKRTACQPAEPRRQHRASPCDYCLRISSPKRNLSRVAFEDSWCGDTGVPNDHQRSHICHQLQTYIVFNEARLRTYYSPRCMSFRCHMLSKAYIGQLQQWPRLSKRLAS